MTTAIIIACSVVGVVGIVVAAWSIINTRKKHYNDYLKRKNKL